MKKTSRVLARLALGVLIVAFGGSGCAQAQPEFQPQVGQEGRDVVWVPTNQAMVVQMLDIAKVTAKDFLIDLGSGDGRTVIAAAKRGAKALGVEYNPDMVELSRRNAAKEGVSNRASFVTGDLFEADLSQATVITLFLLPDINIRLRPKLLDLRPGTRIVSNTFTMGEWEPDATADVKNECASYCTALLWIVPAKVEGTWKIPQGEVSFKQTYQKLSGRLYDTEGESVTLTGRVRGEEIRFTAGGRKYVGRLKGGKLELR